MRMLYFILKLCVAVAVGVVAVMTWSDARAKYQELQNQTDVGAIKERFAAASTSEELQGELLFTEARELLATSDLDGAREQLLRIVDVYPSSRPAAESRRILGEMHLDRVLSLDDMSNKKRHVVQRGDTFIGIAQKYETTLDMLMFLNGLTSLSGLQPNDELVVMPLNFSIVIKPEVKELELWDREELLKTYSIVRQGSEMLWQKTQSKINGKAGYLDGRRVVPRRLEDYRRSMKTLSFDGLGPQLRSVRELTGEEKSRDLQALYLADADMEELAMLLRVQNEVVIRFSQQ